MATSLATLTPGSNRERAKLVTRAHFKNLGCVHDACTQRVLLLVVVVVLLLLLLLVVVVGEFSISHATRRDL